MGVLPEEATSVSSNEMHAILVGPVVYLKLLLD